MATWWQPWPQSDDVVYISMTWKSFLHHQSVAHMDLDVCESQLNFHHSLICFTSPEKEGSDGDSDDII